MNICSKLLIASLLALPLLCQAEEAKAKMPAIICPLKTDPPPSIDGNPKEWQALPGVVEITGEMIKKGKEKWKGDADLSGAVQFCWDSNYLYVLAQVTDDKILVTKTGVDMWRTDHVELDIDPFWTPESSGIFGKQQFVIGLSPGNLKKTGDPMQDIEPEFYIYYPQEISQGQEIDIAASRTEGGYIIEARIPWKMLGIKPEQGKTIGADFHLSDSDDAADQEKYTSLNPEPWAGRKRERMLPFMLTSPLGK